MKAIITPPSQTTARERKLLQLVNNRRAVVRDRFPRPPRNPIVTDALIRAANGSTATVVAPTVETAERLATHPGPHPFCGSEPSEEEDSSSVGHRNGQERGVVGEDTRTGNGIVEFDAGKVYFEAAEFVDGPIAENEAFYVVHGDLIPEVVEEFDEKLTDNPLTVSVYSKPDVLNAGYWETLEDDDDAEGGNTASGDLSEVVVRA